ncbi:guanine nucleotide-binding protein-like 3 [Boleophthalmus pectinirostris]|uniref:guanine nucleotide-binding protein-like 3 n=1 Tax=Boleophthalmus pectinirostris TaxID=150288 RepID=UPI00242B7D8D|nr:guanine nucleotide-binding protein-like 3 [Boleophthalmus pectinirostris]
MKRPKLRKASKRVSCAKRYKIQKKVREHNRKLRKEAKKKGITKRPKKDLGVPSSAPFKEEVLREAEQRRLQIEEEKEKRKQAKKEERAQKRKKEKEGSTKEAEPKAKKARKDEAQRKQKAVEKNSKHYLCSELNKVIDASDVIIEVLDARDPLGCRCPQLEETVLQKNKKLIFLLNKIDLVPKDNAEKWLQCLQREFPVLAFKASTQIQDKTMQEKKSRITPSNGLLDRSRGAACFGQNCLSDLLTSFYTASNREGALKVGLVGFPNVGKSSVINSVKGVLACNAGVKRGITKSMQEVHILKNINLIDSPGVVAEDSNPAPALALRSLRVEEGLESELQAATTLLKHCDKTQVMLQYTVPDYRNPLEFLTMFAKKRGFLQKGGVANTEQAASVFLADWTGAKLSYHCKPPEKSPLPPYVSEETVAEMKKGWDLKKIQMGNEETLKAVKFPNPASSISFTSRGPTAGVLKVTEIIVTESEQKTEEDGEDEDEENEEMEEEVDLHEEDVKRPQKKVTIAEPPAPVQPVTVNISSSTADDAYDFSVDFK